MEKSLLMCDSTEGNGKAEIVMDYVMSYSLRHAEDKYLIEKPMLCRYCRYMLGALLGISIDDNTNIESVKVWKEWQYIDLCIEVIVKEGRSEHKYALIIENKYYSKLHDEQLSKYKKIFDGYYDKRGVAKEYRRYRLVTCFDEKRRVESVYGIEVYDTSKKQKQDNFLAHTFYDLLPEKYWSESIEAYEETESDIFNEFWLRKW